MTPEGPTRSRGLHTADLRRSVAAAVLGATALLLLGLTGPPAGAAHRDNEDGTAGAVEQVLRDGPWSTSSWANPVATGTSLCSFYTVFDVLVLGLWAAAG